MRACTPWSSRERWCRHGDVDEVAAVGRRGEQLLVLERFENGCTTRGVEQRVDAVLGEQRRDPRLVGGVAPRSRQPRVADALDHLVLLIFATAVGAIAADFGFYEIMKNRGYERPVVDRCLADELHGEHEGGGGAGLAHLGDGRRRQSEPAATAARMSVVRDNASSSESLVFLIFSAAACTGR